MFGFIRDNILASKQNQIKRRFPDVAITLHRDMPASSMNTMVVAAGIVSQVNKLESQMQALTDEQLKAKTDELRSRIFKRQDELAGEFNDLQEAIYAASIPEDKEKIKNKIRRTRNLIFGDCLAEAFAVVREASRRTIGLRHFDVQIAGGFVLHEGSIAEMTTGEGKTLVATLPAYLNALLGRGVHIVTVNDYLARRDREWMGPIFEFLGLSVGVIQHDMSDDERRVAYACDITYGTNNEFGFDYLRDNMKYSQDELVQRPFFYAIVDEVDSILVDEARTPLIISGPAEESTDKYYTACKIAAQLKGRRVTEKDEIDAKHKGQDLSKGFDYLADEKAQTVAMSEEGEAKAARLWGVESLHLLETIEYRHHTIQALKAKEFFTRDVEYVVKEGQVIIVDEFTGRLMPGRRWSDGLHQAVEAKEGMRIERENQTLATITFQNYFRMYEKLAGMTGTAYTEANEFKSIYQLDVVVIPTNKLLIRQASPDPIYKTEKEKFKAVVDEIAQWYEKGRPVLVGTITIEKSEVLSALLKQRGITHQVLNAKYHEMEAQIIAQAGKFKAVTIATNMAGRGTDILLGGNPDFLARSLVKQKISPEDPNYPEEYRQLYIRLKKEAEIEHEKVVALGGLHVLGTERHESRRIDNQLRGRSGRQGDPGSSRFYVSFEDDLMRLFGSDRLGKIVDTIGFKEGEVIEHPWVSKTIEIAQRRVEQYNFEIRKQLLEYDNVMNKQREIIYKQRKEVLSGKPMRDDILERIKISIDVFVNGYFAVSDQQEINQIELLSAVKHKYGVEVSFSDDKEKMRQDIEVAVLREFEAKEKSLPPGLFDHLHRMLLLQIIDGKWKDHLYAMDSLREGIGLRAYGQRDPLVEYKREGFNMFASMMDTIDEEVVEAVCRIAPVEPTKVKRVFSQQSQEMVHPEKVTFSAPTNTALAQSQDPQSFSPKNRMPQNSKPQNSHQEKVGRNDPCPCGSGKKFKKCCGQ